MGPFRKQQSIALSLQSTPAVHEMRRWFLSYHSPDQALAERLKAGPRDLRRNGETDRSAPRVPRGEATWNCLRRYAGDAETLFHAVYGWLIIDFHRKPFEARPLAIANARAVAVPDVDSYVVVIAARG